MSRKPIAVAGGLLLLVAGIALASQDLPGVVPPIGGGSGSSGSGPGVPPISPPSAPSVTGGVSPPPFGPPLGGLPGVGALTPPPPPAAPKPLPEPTLDELLASLEKLRGEKAELEKKEQDLVKAIQKKATEQKVRMEKLGVTVQPAMPPIPVVPVGGIAPPVQNPLTKY